MIELHGVSKYYGRVCALSDVSLRARAGEVMLLLGANGAGKSTLLRSVLGITSYRGTIRLDGHDPLREGKLVRRRAGYMPQNTGLHHDLTVAETMGFYAALRDVANERGNELLAELGLERNLETAVGELSGGMKQRLSFALSLLSDPPVLLLDEPTASLDAPTRDLLAGRVRALADDGKTVLLSTHSQGQIHDIADRAVTMDSGRVIADRRLGPTGASPRSASGKGNGDGQ